MTNNLLFIYHSETYHCAGVDIARIYPAKCELQAKPGAAWSTYKGMADGGPNCKKPESEEGCLGTGLCYVVRTAYGKKRRDLYPIAQANTTVRM